MNVLKNIQQKTDDNIGATIAHDFGPFLLLF